MKSEVKFTRKGSVIKNLTDNTSHDYHDINAAKRESAKLMKTHGLGAVKVIPHKQHTPSKQRGFSK